ncbi:MAG TPA: ABC transporter substrate-binding protein [Chloroflexota bacterium]|nr:ABC transporter substrate-binding protein [Chloroflexota bacterium]
MKLPLTLACGDYDRTRGLRFGLVQAEGIDLNYLCMPVEETFWRQARSREFDASEMSMGSYLIRRARGIDDLIAIPVFPSRMFRHGYYFIHAGSGIKSPEDLKGRKMGVPEYQITAAIWMRGILEHDFGVSPRDVRWFSGGLFEPGRIEKQHITLPEGVVLESIPEGRTLSEMIATGEVEALITARAPLTFRDGTNRVARLFPSYRELERDYFRRTRIFPIMHTVVIKREVLSANPWVAMNLYKAFCAAKAEYLASFADDSAMRLMLPGMTAELEEARDVMGEDFWPYGLEPNRHVLQTLMDYAIEQGLLEHRMALDDLFAPETLETYRI